MANILVVDDDDAVRASFVHALKVAGFDATPVANGVEALELLAGYEFDAIICDYRMPELGGEGFYEQIEERFPAMAARVIFVTGFALDPKVRKNLDQHGQPVLAKPVELKDLVNEVGKMVQRSRSRPSSNNYRA